MEFEIIKGNIVDVYAEAIVLPANNHLKEGPGASQAIFEKAGRKQLSEACNKIGYCETGHVVITPAFDLSSNYIIHTVVPKWIDGKQNEYEYLSSAYMTALKAADIMSCKSIAFPLLGSGNNGYDLELAFKIAEESICQFEAENIKKVYLVIYGNRIYEYLSNQGYPVIINDIVKHTQNNFFIKFVNDSMGLGKVLYDEGIRMAKEYLNNEENRRQLIHLGMTIFSKIIAERKNK